MQKGKESKLTIYKLNKLWNVSPDKGYLYLKNSELEEFIRFMEDDYSDRNLPHYNIFDELLDERIQWDLEGKCSKCGGDWIWENNGFDSPGPEKWEVYCGKCNKI